MLGKLRRAAHRFGRGGKFQIRAFSNARRWSNVELRRFGGLFPGDAVNVSAWEDRDKEGGFYKDYFSRASAYLITNFGTDQGVLQHTESEIYLDLTQDLDPALAGRFATVFNHTTLEHIWDFRKAFENLCLLSSDIVVIVLPWLQPLHANYGDFWRFSPQATVRLFEEQGFKTLHLSWNEHPASAVYVFAIASRHPDRWETHFPNPPSGSQSEDFTELPANFAGARAFG